MAAWSEASRNRRCRGAEIPTAAPVPIPVWTLHNRLRRRRECAPTVASLTSASPGKVGPPQHWTEQHQSDRHGMGNKPKVYAVGERQNPALLGLYWKSG